MAFIGSNLARPFILFLQKIILGDFVYESVSSANYTSSIAKY